MADDVTKKTNQIPGVETYNPESWILDVLGIDKSDLNMPSWLTDIIGVPDWLQPEPKSYGGATDSAKQTDLFWSEGAEPVFSPKMSYEDFWVEGSQFHPIDGRKYWNVWPEGIEDWPEVDTSKESDDWGWGKKLLNWMTLLPQGLGLIDTPEPSRSNPFSDKYGGNWSKQLFEDAPLVDLVVNPEEFVLRSIQESHVSKAVWALLGKAWDESDHDPVKLFENVNDLMKNNPSLIGDLIIVAALAYVSRNTVAPYFMSLAGTSTALGAKALIDALFGPDFKYPVGLTEEEIRGILADYTPKLIQSSGGGGGSAPFYQSPFLGILEGLRKKKKKKKDSQNGNDQPSDEVERGI